MTKKQNGPIDFVVLWVDPNDPKWREKKAKYSPAGTADNSAARYREWDNLKYWFRGVAKFAPWVRKIHFVSDGQIPEWLNTDNPRLHIVDHSDYMPKDALPVFNSNAIEMGIYRIEGLSDHFVCFNDDMFLTSSIRPEYYFVDGLPVDMAGETRAPDGDGVFACTQRNNYQVINRKFKKRDVQKRNALKWFNPLYGKTFLRTLMNIARDDIGGLVIPHLSVAYRKSDWERVWTECEEKLTKTQFHRFRDAEDMTHYLFRFWRMCQGEFYPRRSKGKYIALDSGALQRAAGYIRRQTFPELCLNDCWTDGDFEQAKKTINDAFEKILPEKCEFER